METILFPGFAIYKKSWTREHCYLKNLILSDISAKETFSFETKGQKISNTDWFTKDYQNRGYIGTITELLERHSEAFLRTLGGYDNASQIDSIWFQQYEQGDFHEYHTHANVPFSSVYYVSLPEGCPSTTFLFDGKEYSIEVKEGDIITFPGYIQHCSKPNSSNQVKTIISFNMRMF